MIKKNCSICEKPTKYEVIYNQHLPKNIKYIDYSARKNPDNYHYEMVRCKNCSLLFASSIYEDKKIYNLYEMSEFNYERELKGLKKTNLIFKKFSPPKKLYNIFIYIYIS